MGRRPKSADDETPATAGVYSVSDTLKKLRKLRPDSSISLLSSTEEGLGLSIPWHCSTGAVNLDWVMGRGIPGGRLVEIYSHNPSEGKSSIGASVIKSAQKAGYAVMLLDSENGTLTERMIELGVDADSLLFECPDTMEQGFDLIDVAIKTIRDVDANVPIIIVWDSIGACPTGAERDAEYDQRTIGLQARVLSSSLKKITQVLRANSASLVCTNQVREKIEVRGYGGDTRDSVGGLGFKFYAHVRIGLRRVGYIKDGDTITGIRVQAVGKKNKISPPFRKTEISIMSAIGVDPLEAEFTFALQKGLVVESGKGYYAIAGQDNKWRRSTWPAPRPADFGQQIADAFGSSAVKTGALESDEEEASDEF